MKISVVSWYRAQRQFVKDQVVIACIAVAVFGLSVTFDVFDKIVAWVYRHDTWEMDELFTVSIYLVFAIGIYAWRRHRELRDQIQKREQAEAEKARLIPELESARASVSTLQRLVPMCSSCKRVRDDRGSWYKMEVYMETQFRARVDDGLCPDCARRLYGERH